MIDEYDIIDYVYDAVESAHTGFTVYKDRSATGESENHVIINHLNVNNPDDENADFINNVHVNVNVFIKLNSNGMIDRPTMRTSVRSIRAAIRNISPVDGQYRHAHIAWTGTVDSAKEGFDCTNIRIDFETDK